MKRSVVFDRLTSTWARWAFAAGAVATATIINAGYQLVVHGVALFTSYYPFLILVALISGRAPAYASLVASVMIVAIFGMDPAGRPWAVLSADLWALIGYLIAGGLMVAITLRMQSHATATNRQRAELQAMLDLVPVGVAISHDARGDQITVSPHFATMLRLSPDHNASLSGPGRERIPYRAMRDGREVAADELPMQVASRTGKEVRDFDCELVFDDGHTLELRIGAAPLFDEHGRVRGAIGAHVDLTDLRRALRALEESSRQKDEFLATLAHELRNPMAPIRHAVALLHGENLPESAERARATIERQAAHMARLLDDLLDLSRITRNAVTLRSEPVNLQSAIRDALVAAQPAFEKRAQQVVISVDDERTMVMGDRERLQQIVGNLFANAAKYSPPGGSIEIAINRRGADVCCSVRDNGIGLAPDETERIFELFAQVKDNPDHSASGLGIGLSVARRLARLHGGDVSVHSDGRGRGSTFTVRLPALPQSNADAGSTRGSVNPVFAKETRVLVVDDNRDAADTLAALLRMSELDVTVAYDGTHAQQLVEKSRPHVVVLDIGMPHPDGLAVASWIRSRTWGESVRLIALTGWGQPGDRGRTAAAGFDIHLTKPVDPDQLFGELHRMLGATEPPGTLRLQD